MKGKKITFLESNNIYIDRQLILSILTLLTNQIILNMNQPVHIIMSITRHLKRELLLIFTISGKGLQKPNQFLIFANARWDTAIRGHLMCSDPERSWIPVHRWFIETVHLVVESASQNKILVV